MDSLNPDAKLQSLPPALRSWQFWEACVWRRAYARAAISKARYCKVNALNQTCCWNLKALVDTAFMKQFFQSKCFTLRNFASLQLRILCNHKQRWHFCSVNVSPMLAIVPNLNKYHYQHTVIAVNANLPILRHHSLGLHLQ